MSSAASAGIRAFGLDRGLPFPLADVEETDVLVLVGSNLVETMPPAARHLDRLRDRGGQRRRHRPASYADRRPRRPCTSSRCRGPTSRSRSGCCTCSSPTGAVDEDYLAERTTGWDDVRESVAGWWPERVERVTGIDASEVRALAAMLAATPSASWC